jgi:hypothetical protein
MQTNALLVASGIHKLCPESSRTVSGLKEKATPMAKTSALALAPAMTLFGRLLASIDRLLMKSAEISNRNGDLPRVGL